MRHVVAYRHDQLLSKVLNVKRIAAIAVVTGLLHAGLAAQRAQEAPAAQDAIISAIKAEGLRGSQAPDLFHHLTDVLGPRLTGSPAHVEAARWAVERFRMWGLANSHLEAFEFGR